MLIFLGKHLYMWLKTVFLLTLSATVQCWALLQWFPRPSPKSGTADHHLQKVIDWLCISTSYNLTSKVPNYPFNVNSSDMFYSYWHHVKIELMSRLRFVGESEVWCFYSQMVGLQMFHLRNQFNRRKPWIHNESIKYISSSMKKNSEYEKKTCIFLFKGETFKI